MENTACGLHTCAPFNVVQMYNATAGYASNQCTSSSMTPACRPLAGWTSGHRELPRPLPAAAPLASPKAAPAPLLLRVAGGTCMRATPIMLSAGTATAASNTTASTQQPAVAAASLKLKHATSCHRHSWLPPTRQHAALCVSNISCPSPGRAVCAGLPAVWLARWSPLWLRLPLLPPPVGCPPAADDGSISTT